VISTGGGKCDPCTTNGYEIYNYEIFSPPYLFKKDGSGDPAPRPVISSVTAAVQNEIYTGNAANASFTVNTPQAASIGKVALVRLSSVTHGVDFEQRYIPLSYTIGAQKLTVTGPSSINIAQPGYYMLFIIDNNGVPSVAQIVRVREGAAPATPVPTTPPTSTPTTIPPTPTFTVTPGGPTVTPLPPTPTRTATPSVPTATPIGFNGRVYLPLANNGR
jgi:hypothetical protein